MFINSCFDDKKKVIYKTFAIFARLFSVVNEIEVIMINLGFLNVFKF
jgi:hypothetical protein